MRSPRFSFVLIASLLASSIAHASMTVTGTADPSNLPGFTGDVTAPSGSNVLTIPDSGVTAGTYSCPNITVNAKGQITSISSGTCSGGGGSGGVLTTSTILSAHPITTADCSKLLQAGTGTTGYFSITLPSASSFPADCQIGVTDGDVSHPKALIDFPGVWASRRLWPGQTIIVQAVNSGWTIIQDPGRYKLTNNLTFNDNPTNGSDSIAVDGLSTGSGAFNSCPYIYNITQTDFDYQGHYITCLIDADTSIVMTQEWDFTGGVVGAGVGSDAAMSPFGAPFTIAGSGTFGTWLGSSTLGNMIVAESGAAIGVTNLYMYNSYPGGATISCVGAGHMLVSYNQFGPAGIGMHNVGSKCTIYSISNLYYGTLGYGVVIEDAARMIFGGTDQGIGAPTFTHAFLNLGLKGFVDANGYHISGSASGLEALITDQAQIYTNGAPQAGFFLGNTAPSIDATSQWK